MKRILALMLTVTLALAALSGCMTSQNSSGNQGEEKPSVNFSSPFDLDCRDDDGCVTTILEYESEQIVNLLNNSLWTSGGVAKVSNDYVLTFGETKIYYCSDTGTFSDIENQRWFALSHDDKGKVNNELPTTYIIPINTSWSTFRLSRAITPFIHSVACCSGESITGTELLPKP